jgi:hypothetical protein
MLDVKKIPAEIVKDLRARGHDDIDIGNMSPEEAFSEFCNYNGLLHWGSSLFSAAFELKRAEDKSQRVVYQGETYTIVQRGTGTHEGKIAIQADGSHPSVSQWVKSEDCYPA